MSHLRPPVLIIGATRSGTSMLGRTMSSGPDTCLWYEPTTLWRIGHAYRSSDVATPEDARPWVRRRIQKEFLRFQERHGGARVIEKTPMNSLRVSYVAELMPNSPLIHVIRDGRAVLWSRSKKYESFASYTVQHSGTRSHLSKRLAVTPWWEVPAYASRMARGLLRRFVAQESGVAWFGVRYPGWKADRDRLTPTEIIAKQWVASVESARDAFQSIPSSRWMEVRYEDLVTDPGTWFPRLYEFAGLDLEGEVLTSIVDQVHADSVHLWKKNLDSSMLDQAMPILRPTLETLGYLDD